MRSAVADGTPSLPSQKAPAISSTGSVSRILNASISSKAEKGRDSRRVP